MRRCVLLLTALLPLAAAAENLYPTRYNFANRGSAMGFPGGSDLAAINLSLRNNGTTFYEDANIVSHVLFSAEAANVNTYSEQIDQWLGQGCGSVTVDQGPANYTDLDRINCTGTAINGRYRYANGSSQAITACAMFAAPAGTGTRVAKLVVGKTGFPGTASVVNPTCWRSDGGACSLDTAWASFGGGSMISYATVTETPVVLCLRAETSSMSGSWGWVTMLGAYDTGSNYVLAGRASTQIGVSTPIPIPYYSRTGAAANATVALADLYAPFWTDRWTQNGTVPFLTSGSPFNPERAGTNGTSATNYYSLGTGNDVLDTAGDRYSCAVFTWPNVTAYASSSLYFNGVVGASGDYVNLNASGNVVYGSYDGTGRSATTANALARGGLNAVCWWRTGNSIFVKLNNSTTATTAGASTETAGTSAVATLGYGAFGFPGQIYEFVRGTGACPGASCEAWATAQTLRPFGAEGLTTSRATVASYEQNGSVWAVPAGLPRITTRGLLVESSQTNRVIQSEDINSWTNTTTTVVQNQGTGTWADLDLLQPAANNSERYYTTATASATSCTSAWFAAPTGTAALSLRETSSGTYSGCSCGRSDGGSCTVTVCSASGLQVDATVGTTPVRVWGCSTHGNTAPTIRIHGGTWNSTYNDILAGRAQVEISPLGNRVSSYIPTYGTTVTRNLDTVSTAWPALVPINRSYFMAATFTPYERLVSGQFEVPMEGYYSGSNAAALYGDATSFDVTSIASGAFVAGPYVTPTPVTTGSFRISAGARVPASSSPYQRLLFNGVPGSGNDNQITYSAGGFTTLYLGTDPGGIAGAAATNGYISDVKVCPTFDYRRCR